jgi:hypothetical protein
MEENSSGKSLAAPLLPVMGGRQSVRRVLVNFWPSAIVRG